MCSSDLNAGIRSLVMSLLVVGVVTAVAPAANAQQYGSNFGWSYSTPRMTYYNGPAYGGYGPYPYPYYGNRGGGNVQYFQRGRNAFWVETYRDNNGRLQTRTGQFYYGGR